MSTPVRPRPALQWICTAGAQLKGQAHARAAALRCCLLAFPSLALPSHSGDKRLLHTAPLLSPAQPRPHRQRPRLALRHL